MARLTLAEALVEASLPNEGPYGCQCGRIVPADALFDARMYDDVKGTFACTVCLSQKEREEQAVLEAMVAWPSDEQLNDLRAERDLLLLKSDHTQLLDYQETLTPDQIEAWRCYRAAVRAVVASAKEGTRVAFPDLPTFDPEEN